MKSEEVLETLYALDKTDFKQSEVWIPGYGRLSLQTLEQQVAEKFQQLADLAAQGGLENAIRIKRILENGVLLSMIDALNAAYQDLRDIKSAGGKRSKVIPSF
jgi:hypothetical protein